MRHFLKFLSSEHRAEAERQDRAPQPRAEPQKVDAKKADGKIDSGRAVPARASARASAEPAPKARPPAAAKPAMTVQPKPKSPPPEFGGLIERRKVSRDGTHATQRSEARKARPIANKTPVTEKSWDQRFDIDANDVKEKLEAAARESTGMFLASLENSAITLADSGLFKLEDEEEAEAKKKKKRESFNPYDHN